MALRLAHQTLAKSALPSLAWAPVRGLKKIARQKVLREGGIITTGRHPDLPQDTSVHVAIPGEQDEGVAGGFSWLGEVDEEISEFAPGEWHPEAKRCGAIARKIGMIALYDSRGVKVVCTVVKIDHCQVMEIKKYISGRGTPRINLSLAAGLANPRYMTKCRIVPFRKAGMAPRKIVRDFQVSLDAVLPVGHVMDARHFVPGQYVDITGKSGGHGFAGGMKRWGFGGQCASHGNSLAHRAIGSTGAAQTPGRVIKGKKMPGRMGNNRVTFHSMLIYKIDTLRNLVFLKGTVPGPKNTFITLKDAVREPFIKDHPPPFPTYKPKPGDELISEYVMDVSHLPDPYAELNMKGH